LPGTGMARTVGAARTKAAAKLAAILSMMRISVGSEKMGVRMGASCDQHNDDQVRMG